MQDQMVSQYTNRKILSEIARATTHNIVLESNNTEIYSYI